MKRTGVAIALLTVVVALAGLSGCDQGDPGQPASGSISVKARPEGVSKAATAPAKQGLPGK